MGEGGSNVSDWTPCVERLPNGDLCPEEAMSGQTRCIYHRRQRGETIYRTDHRAEPTPLPVRRPDMPEDQPRCLGTTNAGDACRAIVGTGEEWCWQHKPNQPPLYRTEVVKVRSEMRELVRGLGEPRRVGPHEALAEEVYRTAGHIAFYEDKILQNAPDDIVDAFWTYRRSLDSNTWNDKSKLASPDDILRVYAGIYLDLYLKEREHMLRAASAAANAGVKERMTRVAEEHVKLMGDALRLMLTDLGRMYGFDPEDERVRGVAHKALIQIAAGSAA
jgi:hypothetical protein